MAIDDIVELAQIHDQIADPDVARLIINHDRVMDSSVVEGLNVDATEIDDGVDVEITLREGTVIEKPVHLCFGMTPERGVQRVVMQLTIERGAKMSALAHCVFPNAVDVQHIMDARVTVAEAADYSYKERHIHSPQGGVEVIPKARIQLEQGARFRTDFELLQGRVGKIDIDYETVCGPDSVMEMTAKIDGTGDDLIKIRESGDLVGEGARGVLTSRVALRDRAEAEIYNKLTATAPGARGHVDCKEIVQDNATAKAIPIVEVNHPAAHVTHEAAIGSVDTKQLQTLMSRGLDEDQAVDIIIQGLLS